MHKTVLLIAAALALSTAAVFGQQPTGSFQVTYFEGLTQIWDDTSLHTAQATSLDNLLNITNDGSSSTTATDGSICVNIYTFAPDEQEVSCCTCTVTPNGLNSLAVSSLVSNTLTPATVTSGVIKLVATTGAPTCDAANPTASTLTTGLHAWSTHVHGNGPGGTASGPAGTGGAFSVTETAAQPGILSAAELTRITSYCGFIEAQGSGYGICSGCSTGGLGGSKK